MIARITTTALGVLFFIYGVIAAVSPLPVGIPFAILGLFMIAGANPAFRPAIRWMRRRWGWFDKFVRMAAPRATGVVRTVIVETDPEKKMEDEKDSGAGAQPRDGRGR